MSKGGKTYTDLHKLCWACVTIFHEPFDLSAAVHESCNESRKNPLTEIG